MICNITAVDRDRITLLAPSLLGTVTDSRLNLVSGIWDQASRPDEQRSHNFSGLVTPPANLQAIPTTATGDGDGGRIKELPSDFLNPFVASTLRVAEPLTMLLPSIPSKKPPFSLSVMAKIESRWS